MGAAAISTAATAATIDVSGAATGANTNRRRCCARKTRCGAVSRPQSGYGNRAHIASTTCIASFAEACSATQDVAANTGLINLLLRRCRFSTTTTAAPAVSVVVPAVLIAAVVPGVCGVRIGSVGVAVARSSSEAAKNRSGRKCAQAPTPTAMAPAITHPTLAALGKGQLRARKRQIARCIFRRTKTSCGRPKAAGDELVTNSGWSSFDGF